MKHSLQDRLTPPPFRIALACIAFLAAGGLLFAASPRPLPTAAAEKSREKSKAFSGVFRELRDKHYFLVGTCASVANAFLDQAGLPRLGQSGPVRGERGDMDRRGERDSPPWFTDNVISSSKPYLAVALSARAEARSWNFKMSRTSHLGESEGLREESTFHFVVESKLNLPSCELVDFKYQLSGTDGGSAPRWEKTLDLDGCMAVYQASDKDPVYAGLPDPAAKWLKDDCLLALHYFKEAKEAMAESVMKEINRPKVEQE